MAWKLKLVHHKYDASIILHLGRVVAGTCSTRRKNFLMIVIASLYFTSMLPLLTGAEKFPEPFLKKPTRGGVRYRIILIKKNSGRP
jgi:hypothetical protein